MCLVERDQMSRCLDCSGRRDYLRDDKDGIVCESRLKNPCKCCRVAQSIGVDGSRPN